MSNKFHAKAKHQIDILLIDLFEDLEFVSDYLKECQDPTKDLEFAFVNVQAAANQLEERLNILYDRL